MTGVPWLLMSLAAGLGAGHILSEARAPRRISSWLKPAPIFCLVLLVGFFSPDAPPLYRYLIITALLISALGDVLLLDDERFIAGLVAFLVGHLFYIGAFSSQVGTAPQYLHLLPLIVWGGVAFWLLRSGLGKLGTPVLVYIAVLMVMIWTAVEFAAQTGAAHARLAAIGALIFGLSDTTLAMARFRQPFRGAQTIILSTYYVAQMLIAASAAMYVTAVTNS